MSDKRPLRLPSVKLISIAALAGIAAGAVAVYVKEAGIGKAVAEAGECAPARVRAEALKPLARGEVAALVTATDARRIDGLSFKDAAEKPVSLADFAGKTLLVNLWATWCVPCRAEMPALDALQKAKGGERFQVVAVSIDTGAADKPKTFLNEIGVSHLGFFRDETMASFNVLKRQGLAFGLPATLILDGEGCLIGSMNGPAAWDGADAARLIEAAITP